MIIKLNKFINWALEMLSSCLRFIEFFNMRPPVRKTIFLAWIFAEDCSPCSLLQLEMLPTEWGDYSLFFFIILNENLLRSGASILSHSVACQRLRKKWTNSQMERRESLEKIWERKEKLNKRKTVYEVNSRRTRDREEKKWGASLFSN